MQDRHQHQQEVHAFLHKHLGGTYWNFTLPRGRGNETYFAHNSTQTCFVKLGVQISRYQAMASFGLTPQILAAGNLTDGTSIIVQTVIPGRNPSRKDFQANLEQVASMINTMHHNNEVKGVLPKASSDLYNMVGFESLKSVKQRWMYYRGQVPKVAEFIDESLAYLSQQVQLFQGSGLIASHNDICNANWLLSTDGHLYLIDLEAMSLDDPAIDIGAILWWYYHPEMRKRFLEIVGYTDNESFQFRMRIRMTIHCLHIILPRENSFDRFDPSSFAESLTDFKAILAGKENPQGYNG